MAAREIESGGSFENAKNKQGKLAFHKFYYEPEFKGGNNGVEDCVKRQYL